MLKTTSVVGPFVACLFVTATSFAQTSATPPADLKAAVSAPAVAGEAPPGPLPSASDSTSAAVSAGGQFATGNSRLAAASGLGKFDMRRGDDAFAFSLGGNYSEAYVTPAPTVIPSATPGGNPTVIPAAPAAWKESTENVQAKLRYDRYFSRDFSAFVQVTGTHDAFQAITFRLNVDPGVKLHIYHTHQTKVWGELGYDFQYDNNYTDSNGLEQAGAGGASLDSNGVAYLIQRSDTIHSGRLFAGAQHNFNKEVSLNVGLEYLQGFGGSGGATPVTPSGYYAFSAATATQHPLSQQVDPVSISLTGSRLNLDLLLAAKLGAGLSVGVGFSAKYNSAPLAGKENLDTASTLTLIYALGSSTAKPAAPPAPATPPCPVCAGGSTTPAAAPAAVPTAAPAAVPTAAPTAAPAAVAPVPAAPVAAAVQPAPPAAAPASAPAPALAPAPVPAPTH